MCVYLEMNLVISFDDKNSPSFTPVIGMVAVDVKNTVGADIKITHDMHFDVLVGVALSAIQVFICATLLRLICLKRMDVIEFEIDRYTLLFISGSCTDQSGVMRHFLIDP